VKAPVPKRLGQSRAKGVNRGEGASRDEDASWDERHESEDKNPGEPESSASLTRQGIDKFTNKAGASRNKGAS
jgi:hypothetical protein